MKDDKFKLQKETVEFLSTGDTRQALTEKNQFDKEIRVGAKAEKFAEDFMRILKKSKADKEAVAIAATAYKGIRSAMDILAKG